MLTSLAISIMHILLRLYILMVWISCYKKNVTCPGIFSSIKKNKNSWSLWMWINMEYYSLRYSLLVSWILKKSGYACHELLNKYQWKTETFVRKLKEAHVKVRPYPTKKMIEKMLRLVIINLHLIHCKKIHIFSYYFFKVFEQVNIWIR